MYEKSEKKNEAHVTYHSVKVLEQQLILSSLKRRCRYMNYAESDGVSEQNVNRQCFMAAMNEST